MRRSIPFLLAAALACGRPLQVNLREKAAIDERILELVDERSGIGLPRKLDAARVLAILAPEIP